MKRTCKQCGKEFELSESEISFYNERGLELPKRCKSCRDKNKGRGGHAEPKQKIVSTPQYNPNNSNNRNGKDKSYVVVAAAAVLLFLVVLGVKSIFSVPSENISLNENVVSSTVQPNQAVADKTVVEEAPPEALETATEEPQQAERKDEEPQKEQLLQQQEQEPVKETATEINTVEIAAAVETVSPTPNTAYHFRKAEYLTEHFQKHGAEFPYATEEEYLLGANNVIQNPNALHKLEAEDGDDVYYVESTREFVIVSTDGYIRTYYLADLDYYNRQ